MKKFINKKKCSTWTRYCCKINNANHKSNERDSEEDSRRGKLTANFSGIYCKYGLEEEIVRKLYDLET